MTQNLSSFRIRGPLAALLVAGLLAGCGKTPDTAAGAGASAPAAKVYLVATDAAYAPFESQNGNGEIVGFDIDVVQAAAARSGIAVKFVNTPWEGIFNALAQGDRDMVVSAVTITAERRQTVDFSQPYFDARQLIAVRSGSPVAKLADLEKLTVGVQNATTGDEVVSRLMGKGSLRIRRFESIPLALKELESGGVDAVVADNGVVAHYLANNPAGGFKAVADDSFAPEQYGIAFRKGNTELRAKINQGLAALRADGSYERIHARYFGVPPGAAAPASPASR